MKLSILLLLVVFAVVMLAENPGLRFRFTKRGAKGLVKVQSCT